MQKMNNKKGVKLLAAVMVFAVAFAGACIILDDESDVYADVPVVKIGETTYTSLSSAISAANDGDTIKAVAQITIDSNITINKNVTIDTDTFNIVITATGTLTVDTGKEVTLKNSNTSTTNLLTINYSSSSTKAIELKSESTLNIEHNGVGTTSGGKTSIYAPDGPAKVLMTGATLNFTTDKGVQGLNYCATNSTINATAISQGKTITGYFTLNKSTVNANDIGIISATLTNNSQIKALQVGVYNKNANLSSIFKVTADNTYTLSTVTITSGSITAKNIIYGLNTDGTGLGTNGITFTGNGTLNADITLISGVESNAFKLVNVTYSGTITYGNSSVVISDVKAADTSGVSFTKGSIKINGATATAIDGKITANGNVEIQGTLDPNTTLVITENSEVKLTDTFTNQGVIENYGKIDVNGKTFNNGDDSHANAKILNYKEISGTIVNTYGSVGNSPDATHDTISGNDPVSVTALEDALGLNRNLDSDYTITTKAFLQDSLVINEGVTLTIASGATLDLNGKTLTVLGNLVVKGNGTIITSAGGTIALGTTGSIDNKGIIGKTNGVKVQIDGYNSNYVTINDAVGIGFDKVKIVGTENVSYYLEINGSVSKKESNAKIEVNGTIYVKNDLTIGNGVTLEIEVRSNLIITKNAVMEISSNGTLALPDPGSGIITQQTRVGTITMEPGATVNLNGNSTAVILAYTGSFETSKDYTGTYLGTTKMEVQGLKGLTIEVVSSSAYNDTVKADVTEQRVLFSGELKDADYTSGTDSTASRLEITGETASATLFNGAKYTGIYVDGTLFINKNFIDTAGDEITFDNAKFTVLGTVSSDIASIPNGIGTAIVGAVYTVESTDASGVKTSTHFIKPFADAFALIDTVKDKTITVYGTVSITDNVTIDADQVVAGTATYTISENGKLSVLNEASLSATGITVYGILYTEADASKPNETAISYDAKVKDTETGNITYYGLAAALKNATAGTNIEVSRTATTENLIIPEDVTVKILSTGSLTVSKNLTVNGTLVNQNSLEVTEKTIVNGTLDLTDGATNTLTGQITVTGQIVMRSAYTGNSMNAFQYVNDDSEYVYTTLSKAAEAVAAKDVQKNIVAIGTVSDSSDVTLSGRTTLTVNGTATLGKVTLDDSTIIVGTTGALSATIIGKTGEETSTTGAITNTVVSVKDAKEITFVNSSVPNAQNVKVWSLKVTTQNTSGNLVGSLNVNEGTLTIANNMNIVNKNNTISVDAGLVVPTGVTLTVATDGKNTFLKVAGTIDVVGTLTVNGIATVSGTINVYKDSTSDAASVNVAGKLTVSGEMNIVEDETDGNGTVTVTGKLFVGTKAETLGASASVVGPVTISGTGYIISFDGADLSKAKINDDANGVSQAKSTVFNINGQPYMTAYAIGAVTYNTVLAAASISLTGYDTTGIGSVASNNTQYWFTDSDMTKNAADSNIGTNSNLFYKARSLNVMFNISVGTGISMSIDGIKMIDNTYSLSVGTHSVLAVVDPGYKGEVSVYFNGEKVTGGTITVTPEMASAAYDGLKVVSATGDITIDAGEAPAPIEKDDGMGITDYLLIVLVILAAILVVIVAIRMMRS